MPEKSDFGYMFDLILSLRRHGVPIGALNFTYFTDLEREWIRSSYELGLGQLEALSHA